MPETPKRFILRGRAHSPQELQSAKERAERAQLIARLPGEGIHEYVRRVSNGDYQLIRTEELNSLNSQNSLMRRELDMLRSQVRQNTLGSSGMSDLTATQVADRMMRARSRAAMDPASAVIPVNLRGLAVDTEERLMVGGPMDGRIVQFRSDATTYQAREISALNTMEIDPRRVSRATDASATRYTVVRYVLFRRTPYGPMMLAEDLLNSPPSVQDAHVNRAMRVAGLTV